MQGRELTSFNWGFIHKISARVYPSSCLHNYSPVLLLHLLFMWLILLRQLRSSTFGDSLILHMGYVCVCVFLFKLKIPYLHLILREFWLWSDSKECFGDRQRLELLEYVFVPCTETFCTRAVAGTLVVSQCLSPFSIALHFIYINVQLKTIFPSFPHG